MGSSILSKQIPASNHSRVAGYQCGYSIMSWSSAFCDAREEGALLWCFRGLVPCVGGVCAIVKTSDPWFNMAFVARFSDCAVCSEGYGRGAGNECHQCTGHFRRVMYTLAALVALITFMFTVLLVIYLVRRNNSMEWWVLVPR